MEKLPLQSEEVKFKQAIVKSENTLFPFMDSDENKGQEVVVPDNPKYFYFKPSYFFNRDFINREDIEILKKEGHKLLSIGCGPAYLERLLVELGVPKENIVISDISDEDFPKGNFKSYVFDMHSEAWPQVEGAPFDVIIIPEAFGVSLGKGSRRPWSVAHALSDVVKKSLDLLKSSGEIRIIDPSFTEEVMGYLEKFVPFGVKVDLRQNTMLVIKKL